MSDPVSTLLSALHQNPGDETAWQALADCLEERGETDRAELVRLTRLYQHRPAVPDWDRVNARLQHLLASGVKPCVPEHVNGLGMRFALIPAGTFLMGSPEDEKPQIPGERPQHAVEITRPFYLGVFPVTQAEYERATGKTPSGFHTLSEPWRQVAGLDTGAFPVENVTWAEAEDFCATLNQIDPTKPPGWLYRLPSEAEWEYGCQGRSSMYQIFHTGNRLSSTQANVNGDDPFGVEEKGPHLKRPCRVGSYPPNLIGLYDMHGNIWEWCADWWQEWYYEVSPRYDPPGPFTGSYRVMRGGGWMEFAPACRAAFRGCARPSHRSDGVGFRVVLASSH